MRMNGRTKSGTVRLGLLTLAVAMMASGGIAESGKWIGMWSTSVDGPLIGTLPLSDTAGAWWRFSDNLI